MRHQRSVRKLGRTTAHRHAMLGNMATSLFRTHAIMTTVARARVLKSYAERLITLGKRGDLHARRLAAEQVHDKIILKKLFAEIAPQFAARNGGYTRVIKIGTRHGDGAHLVRIELLIPKAVVQTDEKHKKGGAKAADADAAKTAKVTKDKAKKAAAK